MKNLTGLGLRASHFNHVIENKPSVDFFEVHSENYFVEKSFALDCLIEISRFYPISFHCIGFSLGSADAINKKHLEQMQFLIEKIKPMMISDHLSWSSIDGRYLNDLLPFPYNQKSLDQFCQKVDQVQQLIHRKILIENPSMYFDVESDMNEREFLNQLVERTGCGLLLDVNNLLVNQHNIGVDPILYINELNLNAVEEIHLAGHTKVNEQLIDDHGSVVSDKCWQLYQQLYPLVNASTLIEWDNNIPDFDTLLNQQKIAKGLQNRLTNKQINNLILANH